MGIASIILSSSYAKLPLSPTTFSSYPRDCRRFSRSSVAKLGCTYARAIQSSELLMAKYGYQSAFGHVDSSGKGKRAYGNGCLLVEKPVECVEIEDTERPLAHFPPDIWGDRFDNFTLEDHLTMERYAIEIEPLKEEVRMMLLDDSMDLEKKMNLIDKVERLGFPYYYKNEIKQLLDQIFEQLSANNFEMDFDLYDTATQFRIFRQHGYNMPCDVFNKFTDGEGKFKDTLRSDERGMLSLYEAAHLRIHGENILDDALIFTTQFLKSIATFSEQARQALNKPLYHNLPRVAARRFITFYEEDEFHDEKLLQLAKMEFNRLQLVHRQELIQLRKWWKNLDFARKLPHVKQRSVETHFFTLSMTNSNGHQYSISRIIFCKMVLLLVALDDTYDAYGTFEELQQLTDVFERWDTSSKEQLPEGYLRTLYEFAVNTCNEFDEEMIKRGKPYASNFAKQHMLEMVKHFFIESKWVNSRHVPKFEEYMATRRITTGVKTLVTTALMGMDDVTESKPYEQALLQSKAMLAVQNMGSLLNDLRTGKMELDRGTMIATCIECYMNDYNMSREEVLQKFEEMVEDAWKDMVYEGLIINSSTDNDSDHMSKPLYDQLLSYARIMSVCYNVTEAYIFVKNTIKEDVAATYGQPFLV